MVLQGTIIGGLLSKVTGMEATLEAATNEAMAASNRIAGIAHAVGLAAALLVLATAIATAVSSGNPSGIIPAAQGVITAAQAID